MVIPKGYHSYSPASVTLFFMPIKRGKKLIGSKGVAISLQPGMWSKTSKKDFRVISADGESFGKIQQEACKLLNKNCGIESYTPLPISQGFGTSASAAITSLLSLNRRYKMNMTILDIARKAQEIELKYRSGLGDVATQITGGIVIRERGGAVYGNRIPSREMEFLCCVVGKKIETSTVEFELFISEGKKAMEKFSRAKTLENAFRIGREFAKNIGVDRDVRGVIEECLRFGNATQIMLGNSVIAYGNLTRLSEILENYGKVYRMKLDFGCSRYL